MARGGSWQLLGCPVRGFSRQVLERELETVALPKGRHASRMLHLPPSCPLTPQAAEEVDRLAAASGKLGVSTNRFVDEQRSDLAVPPGAEWKPVRVAFKRCVGGSGGQLDMGPSLLMRLCGLLVCRWGRMQIQVPHGVAASFFASYLAATTGRARTSSPSCPMAPACASTAPSACRARRRPSHRRRCWMA